MSPECTVPRHITALYVFMVANCMTMYMTIVGAEVAVVSQITNDVVQTYPDLPAQFGPRLPSGGLRGLLVYSNPPDACSIVQPPPSIKNYTGDWILLIRRYNCNFEDKIRAAQTANYSAAIVHNVDSNAIDPMWANDPDDIDIPSVFIGAEDGKAIKTNYQFNDGYYVILTDQPIINLNNYLLPFAIVVGVCFLIMLIFMVLKCVKDHRRQRRHRLPAASLKKIPTTKFKKGDPYDTCAICLDDYVEGEKLRILPCNHAYHCKCIDPWLTKNKRVCPVCKRKVFAQDEHFSDSESESEDEHTPLMNSNNYGTQGGTFNFQRTNPFARAESESTDSVNINNVTQEIVTDTSCDTETPTTSRQHSNNELGDNEQVSEEQGAVGYSNQGFEEEYFTADGTSIKQPSSSQHATITIEAENIQTIPRRKILGKNVKKQFDIKDEEDGIWVSSEHSINREGNSSDTSDSSSIETTVVTQERNIGAKKGRHRTDLVV